MGGEGSSPQIVYPLPKIWQISNWFVLESFFFLFFVLAKGVDPAKPLIRNRLSGRLDAGDANVVQIIHATARYGDSKRMGHVDFCLNGARVQPFCANVSSEYFFPTENGVVFGEKKKKTSLSRIFFTRRKRIGNGPPQSPNYTRSATRVHSVQKFFRDGITIKRSIGGGRIWTSFFLGGGRICSFVRRIILNIARKIRIREFYTV